jgi:hypothetical protein
MAKSATLKDVLYGLEYGKQQLCRWPSHEPAAWSLEPGGVKVPADIANKALMSGAIVRVAAQRFGEDRYEWQRAAA